MGRDRKNENRQEHWTKMSRNMIQTDAWRALSTAAHSLYILIKLEWKGPKANNNGKLRLSVRQAAELMGCNPKTAARAFHDLQAKGFIVQTEGACLSAGGNAQSPSYEVTEIALPSSNMGRHLYRKWEEGRDFPVKMTATNNPTGFNGKTVTGVKNVVSIARRKS